MWKNSRSSCESFCIKRPSNLSNINVIYAKPGCPMAAWFLISHQLRRSWDRGSSLRIRHTYEINSKSKLLIFGLRLK